MTIVTAAIATRTSLAPPRRGWIAASSSCSSSLIAATSHRVQVPGNGRRATRPGLSPRTSRYGAKTPSASSSAAKGDTTPSTSIRETPAIHSPTVPPSSTTRRCRAMCPATIPARPISAAMLKTLDPRTTPAPMRSSCPTSAVTAAVISGASAASAASMPSSASESPSLAPTRSSEATSRQLVNRLATAPATKIAPRAGSDTASLGAQTPGRRLPRSRCALPNGVLCQWSRGRSPSGACRPGFPAHRAEV